MDIYSIFLNLVDIPAILLHCSLSSSHRGLYATCGILNPCMVYITELQLHTYSTHEAAKRSSRSDSLPIQWDL